MEIKHGRISKLAFLGQIITLGGLHLPGNVDYSGDSFDPFSRPEFEYLNDIIQFITLISINILY